MSKINFTPEHDKELKELFVKLSFGRCTLGGKFGANSYTPSDLLYTATLPTLQNLHRQLKKDVAALEDLDEWSATEYQVAKANNLRGWQRYVNLLIGYNKHLAEKAREVAKKREESQRKLANLKNIKDAVELEALKKLSPEELQKQIDELENNS